MLFSEATGALYDRDRQAAATAFAACRSEILFLGVGHRLSPGLATRLVCPGSRFYDTWSVMWAADVVRRRVPRLK